MKEKNTAPLSQPFRVQNVFFARQGLNYFFIFLNSHSDYILFVCESIFNTWFSIELLLRFLSCDEKFKFVKDWLNIIDLIAIMPYFVMLSASSTTKDWSYF